MPGEEEARVGSSAQLATTALTTTTTTPSGSGTASSILSSTTSSSAAPKVSLPVLALRGNPASTGTGSVPSLPTVSGGSSSTLATITTPATTIAPIAIASCPSTSVNNNAVTTINATGTTLLTDLNSSGLNTGTVDTTVFTNNATKKHQSFQTNPLGGTRAVPLLQSNSTVSGIYNNYNNNKPQQHPHLHHILQQPALSSQLSLKPITSTTPNGHPVETKLDAGTCNGHGGYHGGSGIEDDEIDDAGDSSKLELHLQFAGIDNETVDVDVEDEENNFESGPMCTVVPTSNKSNGNGDVGGRTGGGAGKSSHPSFPGDISGGGVVVASSVAAAGSAAPTSTTSSTLGGGGGGTGPTNSLGVGGQLVGTTVVGGASTLGDEEEDEEEEDVEEGKTVECTEVVVPDQTFAEKCLFYTTAFFILLAVFSLFAFLFLVPFVIDPAFTTIFMEFDPEPAFCQTVSFEKKEGLSNCNWTSCREGCTREVFQCKQIKVNYRSARKSHSDDFQRGPNNNRNNHNAINHVSNLGGTSSSLASSDLRLSEHYGSSFNTPIHNYNNLVRNSLIDYGGGVGAGSGGAIAPINTYHSSSSASSVGHLRDASSSKLSKSHFKNLNNLNNIHHSSKYAVLGGSAGGGLGELTSAIVSRNSVSARSSGMMNLKQNKHNRMSGQQVRSSSVQKPSITNGEEEPIWDYVGAHLFPNVKGCGYPPVVVCSDFVDKYSQEGTNFSCYYSKVDRALVVTSYDMSRVIMDLVYSMAIPIPSFIISVVYLIFAYFRIYNTESSSSTHETGGGGRAERLNSSSTTTNLQNPGSANRGGGGSSADDPDAETSISVDDKTCIIQRSTSRGLNALADKLPNSGKGLHAQVIEMNDLNPQLRHPVDGDVFLPKRNNNCNPPPPHERNGPTNPAARNKGGEPTLLGGFEETDF